MLARLPGEPAGLLEVVSAARQVRVVGAQDVDGTPTRHLAGRVDPRAAVRAGLGTSAQLAVAGLPTLPVGVWLDGDGLPRLPRCTVTLPSPVSGADRTTVTTYDDRGWGEPVDLTG